MSIIGNKWFNNEHITVELDERGCYIAKRKGKYGEVVCYNCGSDPETYVDKMYDWMHVQPRPTADELVELVHIAESKIIDEKPPIACHVDTIIKAAIDEYYVWMPSRAQEDVRQTLIRRGTLTESGIYRSKKAYATVEEWLHDAIDTKRTFWIHDPINNKSKRCIIADAHPSGTDWLLGLMLLKYTAPGFDDASKQYEWVPSGNMEYHMLSQTVLTHKDSDDLPAEYGS